MKIQKDSHEKDLTWDGKGRLTSVADTQGLAVNYTYDPLDRTYSSQENGTTQTYVYNMNSDTEMAVLDQSLTISSLFQSGADGLISATTSQGTSYYSFNPHSDASLITDASGNTTTELHYDSWGNVVGQTSEPNNYLGKYQKRDYQSTGLIKMGARFYDPDSGRFISRDSLEGQDELPITKNQYIYAYDDPINKLDLMGTGTMEEAQGNPAQERTIEATKASQNSQGASCAGKTVVCWSDTKSASGKNWIDAAELTRGAWILETKLSFLIWGTLDPVGPAGLSRTKINKLVIHNGVAGLRQHASVHTLVKLADKSGTVESSEYDTDFNCGVGRAEKVKPVRLKKWVSTAYGWLYITSQTKFEFLGIPDIPWLPIPSPILTVTIRIAYRLDIQEKNTF